MLLSTGKTLQELECERYEISLCEPLQGFRHDHSHTGGVPKDVKETITQYCKGILGKTAKQEDD